MASTAASVELSPIRTTFTAGSHATIRSSRSREGRSPSNSQITTGARTRCNWRQPSSASRQAKISRSSPESDFPINCRSGSEPTATSLMPDCGWSASPGAFIHYSYRLRSAAALCCEVTWSGLPLEKAMNHSQYTRREFVTVPAAAAGSAALLSAQSPNGAVRVAFIGVGNRGSYLLKNMLKVQGVQIVAICDINPETLQRAMNEAAAAGHQPEGSAEFRKVLDRKDVDAVVIATPVDLHKDMAVASLEVGKHVYCEKPMALTPDDCRIVTNAAGSAKGIFQAGFQLRHDPNRAASMGYIKKGGI